MTVLAKNNKRNNNKPFQQQNANKVSLGIDYKMIENAFYIAMQRDKQDELKKQEKQQEDTHEKWQKVLGIKEFPQKTNTFIRVTYVVRNFIFVFLHIIFFRRKDAQFQAATSVLMKFSLGLILCITKMTFYILSFVLIISSFFDREIRIFRFSLVTFIFGFSALLLGSIVRIAEYEVENIRDTQYTIALLSAATSFIAMMFAIIAIFVR